MPKIQTIRTGQTVRITNTGRGSAMPPEIVLRWANRPAGELSAKVSIDAERERFALTVVADAPPIFPPKVITLHPGYVVRLVMVDPDAPPVYLRRVHNPRDDGHSIISIEAAPDAYEIRADFAEPATR